MKCAYCLVDFEKNGKLLRTEINSERCLVNIDDCYVIQIQEIKTHMYNYIKKKSKSNFQSSDSDFEILLCYRF